MLPKTPYKITIDDLFVEVEHLYIEPLHFIPPVTVFKDNIYPTTGVTGKYTDKDFLKSADITVQIVFSGTKPLDAGLKFIGKFSVNRHSAIKVPYVAIRLIQKCFEIIEDYIKDKPLKDKDGNLFFMPPFTYAEDEFKEAVFE